MLNFLAAFIEAYALAFLLGFQDRQVFVVHLLQLPVKCSCLRAWSTSTSVPTSTSVQVPKQKVSTPNPIVKVPNMGVSRNCCSYVSWCLDEGSEGLSGVLLDVPDFGNSYIAYVPHIGNFRT